MRDIRFLKAQLRAGALASQELTGARSYESKGKPSTILFPSEGARHGNFFSPAWEAIQKDPDWAKKLHKKHPTPHALPEPYAHDARELDSSHSSDALLMNFFCPAGAAVRLAEHLGIDIAGFTKPQFGFKAKVPLANGEADATEIDLRFGDAVCEAKLTEGSFTLKRREVVERYRDLDRVFNTRMLPGDSTHFRSYQLIRNVLAAAHHSARFFVFVDSRRSDLRAQWEDVETAIADNALRARCKLVHWQDLVAACEPEQAHFLKIKYGF